jgi:DNA-binding LacI/PurR family transcriptional regulator
MTRTSHEALRLAAETGLDARTVASWLSGSTKCKRSTVVHLEAAAKKLRIAPRKVARKSVAQ